MKIIVFHQPFPMGNYKVCTAIAKKLSKMGHEVYSLQQLNGAQPDSEYVQQIIDLNPDIVYSEMLDNETFKIVEKLKCKNILTYVSKGILQSWDDIYQYQGDWFTHIMTNSKQMETEFKSRNIPVVHFEWFFSVLEDEDKIFTSKYNHDCTFLGMGFQRMSSDVYQVEREAFFRELGGPWGDIDYKIYGNGWPQTSAHGGILPGDDIGKLYSSSKTGIAIIAPGQRDFGMINNRYSEMGSCGIPIITLQYPTVDWTGGEKYLNFVEPNRQSVVDLIKKIIYHLDEYKEKGNNMKKFIEEKSNVFFEKLQYVVEGRGL